MVIDSNLSCGHRVARVLMPLQHTTTAVTLNEHESRLIQDMRDYFARIAPPDDPYLHNDIHLRPSTEDVSRGPSRSEPRYSCHGGV